MADKKLRLTTWIHPARAESDSPHTWPFKRALNTTLIGGFLASGVFLWNSAFAHFAGADSPPATGAPSMISKVPKEAVDDGDVITADLFHASDMDAADQVLAVGAGVGLLVVAVVAGHQRVRRRHLRELNWRARHDALTGLTNRWAFESHLEAALEAVRTGEQQAALLWIDLDDFKSANDALGHAGGDAILVTLAGRLRACIGDGDTLARFGGDEFVILARRADANWEEGVLALAQRILASLSAPMDIAGEPVVLFASIGVSLIPKHGTDAQALLAHANRAARRVKEDGGNGVRFFPEEERDAANDSLTLRSALAGALERDELTLRYQPVVALATGEVSGVEALLRWRHPALGEVAPESFIPLAEDSGLMQSIGKWVIARACGQLAAWRCDDGAPHLRMSVNLSPRQLGAPDLPDYVASALRIHGLSGDCLELEVTEGAVLRDVKQATANMEALRGMGVGLAIDDFGTGYSSLSYLKRLPVNRLKIDKAFIRPISDAGEDGTIAAAIIALAHKLGLAVVAEGAETHQQLAFLRAHECEEAQGHYLSSPVSSSEMGRLLRAKTVLWQAEGDPLRQKGCLSA